MVRTQSLEYNDRTCLQDVMDICSNALFVIQSIHTGIVSTVEWYSSHIIAFIQSSRTKTPTQR